jgi:putative SOS response-associated peptidase YedK
MCINFRPPSPELLNTVLGVLVDLYKEGDWPAETWKDYAAPIIRAGADGRRVGRLATYGMVPRKCIPPGVKVFDTMNARAESIGEKRSFSSAWRKTQLCAVPMMCFYEPGYESGKAERFGIGMQDDSMFSVAGLWREWAQPDGTLATSFTQLTINADEHPLMRRFHKPGDEKRSLVVIPNEELDDWLACRDPELARSFLRPFPAESMKAWLAPLPPRAKKKPSEETPPDSLF